jgi:hypothetical protein
MRRRTRATLTLLLVALATAVPRPGLAQDHLSLRVDVSKAEFFEGEPIYLLIRLQNVGADTARIYHFGMTSPAVTLSVRRGDGKVVGASAGILDMFLPDSWPGEPLPPGAIVSWPWVLQTIAGEPVDISRHLFSHHLARGDYEMQLAFKAHWGIRRAKPLNLESAPVAFQIRKHTSAERSEISALEAIHSLPWDSLRAAGYWATLIDWVERRFNEQPDDPFLPFLLSAALYMAPSRALEEQVRAGKAHWFYADTSQVVSRLRHALIERWKHSVAGALVVQSLSHQHQDEVAVLAEELGATPAGEMARVQVERIQRAQRHKK